MLGLRTPVVMNVLVGLLAGVLPQLVFAAAADPSYKSVSADANKKIGKVIKVLQDIHDSVEAEEKKEKSGNDAYVKWCVAEKAAIKSEQQAAKKAVDDTKGTSNTQVAASMSAALVIRNTQKQIDDTADEIAQLTALRKGEAAEYAQEMQLNTESLSQINKAIAKTKKIKKQGGFLQNGVMKSIQLNKEGESNYVLGVLNGLKKELDNTKLALEKVEKAAIIAHNKLKGTKEKSLKGLQTTLAAKKVAKATTDAKETGTKRDIGTKNELVEKLATQSSNTNAACDSAKKEWDVRQADRKKEKAAILEAVRYLVDKDKADKACAAAKKKGQKMKGCDGFLQETADDETDEEPASVVFAPSFLQVESDSSLSASEFYKAADAALQGEDVEVDEHMKKDTFNSLKVVVAKLIATHQTTQVTEKKKRDKCKKDIADKMDEKETIQIDLLAVTADKKNMIAQVQQLGGEVKASEAIIVKDAASLKAAGVIRKKAKGLFEATTKDRTIAVKVLAQAITVLQSFYDLDKYKSALVQGQPKKKKTAPRKAAPKIVKTTRKNVASFGAVSMIQGIADDIVQEQKDAAIAEQKAEDIYKKLQDDTFSKTEDTREDITKQSITKAQLGVQINTAKETESAMIKEKKSNEADIKALGIECNELIKHFDARTKARSFEISQLRDVTDIISGSSIAVRTGLIEQSDDTSADGGEADSTADSDSEA